MLNNLKNTRIGKLLAKLFAANRKFWTWYRGLYKGTKWYTKTATVIVSLFVSFFVYLFLVDINFLWLFGKSPGYFQIKSPDTYEASEIYSADGVMIGKFFKNLENIQGDERDVIIFSLGYGPDEEGHMSMNFGPVNQEGGHRRLNVAVTRARQELLVYTSFEPSAMRTTEHSARGLRDLKAFLEYAKQGAAVLDCQPGSASKEKETINRQIAEKLREKGWKADINIGTGKFRIDVAVHHPEKTDEYCLGIMFDDDASALQDTVRDRNLLQKNVLQRMGWNILNLWLLDWYEDSETQIQRIEDTLKNMTG